MDTDLLRAMLEMDKIVAAVERVETREQFLGALEAGGYDLIISDYSLPSFDGLTALSLARELIPSLSSCSPGRSAKRPRSKAFATARRIMSSSSGPNAS